MPRTKATWVGSIAVLLWALLALFTVASAPVPPLQLNAICFGIAGLAGFIWTTSQGQLGQLRKIPIGVYIFGTAGLFGYHLLYFSALRLAPPAQAGLIAYLWPLFIVLFSGFLPNERLKLGHLLGAVLAFSGAAVVILGTGTVFAPEHYLGYSLALGCALTWSGYSVISRLLGKIPTSSIAVFCTLSAALSLAAHLIFETTVWPASVMAWMAIGALGIGPVGLAFYVWDIGVKHGDIQLLGVIAYAAPLLSTIILVAAGMATASWMLFIAALLISGGAFVAARFT